MIANAARRPVSTELQASGLTLVGHPFAPIGCGENLRSCYRALRRVGLEPRVVNVYGPLAPDPLLVEEFLPAIEDGPCGRLNVFLINGDEVEPVLERLGERVPASASNVVVPMWELERYPLPWARQLERFDEVWVPSAFVRDAIEPVVRRPVVLIPCASGVRVGPPLGRRYFGIRESAYVFLFAFDLRSYVERKNPLAVLSAFEQLVRARPRADLSLVIKIGGGRDPEKGTGEVAREIRQRAAACPSPIVLIDRDILDHEVKSLLRSCDAFVSLHRSEGFGRLMAESMLLAKPVIATAYSGNLEFMTPETSFLIPHRLVDVGPGQYPFGEGQVWAEPDVAAAVQTMERLVDDAEWGRRCGERASRHLRTHFSHRAIGLRYLDRLSQIARSRAS